MAPLPPYRIRENFSHDHGHDLPSLKAYFEVLRGIEEPLICSFNGTKKKPCFTLSRINFGLANEDYRVSTSYYVGTHWLIKNQLPVSIFPKFDSTKKGLELNYLEMLVQALKNPEAPDHLEDLVDIYFDHPSIIIDQKEDLLTPLLVVQYLQVLKQIVRKGLKKSYRRVSRNLRSRVKGKVLVNETIKTNHARHKMLHTACTYDEFGVDHLENRLLKKAFRFGRRALQSFPISEPGNENVLEEMVRYIDPAFQQVGDEVVVRQVKHFKPNPLYREYEQALKLAVQILKRFGYNITKTESEQGKIETPPHWIDMSKLFELYVLQKLKEEYPGKGEVLYQPNINGRYPDYLLNTKKNNQMVVDAKYKDYGANNKSIEIKDIRQVSAYARMSGIYNRLGRAEEKPKTNIDCLIIYPDIHNGRKRLNDLARKEEKNEYEGIYTIGLKLPLIESG